MLKGQGLNGRAQGVCIPPLVDGLLPMVRIFDEKEENAEYNPEKLTPSLRVY